MNYSSKGVCVCFGLLSIIAICSCRQETIPQDAKGLTTEFDTLDQRTYPALPKLYVPQIKQDSTSNK